MATKLVLCRLNWTPIIVCMKMEVSLYFVVVKAFLPLSFAKSAEEREEAEEQLLETQMDLRDIKRLSQEIEDSTESSQKAFPSEVSHSSLKHDEEDVFEMKKRAKRKIVNAASVERTKRSSTRKKNPLRKIATAKGRLNPGHDEPYELDQKRKMHVTAKQVHVIDHVIKHHAILQCTNQMRISRGTQRKLLSYDTNNRKSPNSTVRQTTSTPAMKKSNDNLVPNRGYTAFGHNLPPPRRGINSSNVPQRWGRLQFYPVDKQDDQMTRMNSAREFVRRMIYAVQMYNHRVNSRALMDAVYRRFGVTMKIPNIVRIPEYDGWIFHQNSTKCGTDGNLLLNADVAKSVVNRYMRALKQASNSKYSLKDIVNVEENHDVLKGDRYLIDLELNVEGKNSSVRLSQYVYQKIGSTELCLPERFVLNQHATVHIIIPVKNQGKWVQHFIDNMVELYLETGDPHVNIIIVDFNSTDIDVTAALKRSQLKRYQVRKLKGAFQRAYGIHAGAALVKNPRDIIFMCDLHLQIPSNIVDIIRKHCIQGMMAFAPIVFRLHCGFSPSLPFGFWELQGYGLFAMYKSDFTRVGGMNYQEFRTTWGGEDWELLDRVLLYKMEVERLRVPKFYHYYHSKNGMWGTRNMFNSYTRDMFGRFDDDSEIITLYNDTKEREEERRFILYQKYYSQSESDS
ncbi:hypothetical protein OS493_034467 [Desmophyllum pertusum]|uniref:Hexosyltransferase n=1 Tax=Desmophyllum pertusum TaxID=174260 RepID=A0A9W9Z7K7_9CNID|nr:hypothetical protein OS493_034467 [Desmophyllum pertusum]